VHLDEDVPGLDPGRRDFLEDEPSRRAELLADDGSHRCPPLAPLARARRGPSRVSGPAGGRPDACLKDDLRSLREELKADLRALEHKVEQVELRTNAALARLKTRLTIPMGAMAVGTVALVTAIDRLF
jgi:hypothetical protein